MELKTDYKNSEVGVIPKDWEVTTFDMIADKNKKWSITGGPFGSNLKVSDYTLNGVQIVQLQNIGDGKFIDDSQIYTSEEKANELLSCNIYPNEIIISKMGDPVARACFIPDKAKRFLMASDGIRLVVNEKEFSKKFIHDYINSIYFRKRAFENSRGSTRLRIGLPELKSLLVIKPKLSEQTAIANALSDADELISSLEKLILKKRNIKQGAIQKLLQPKEGWETKTLKELAKYRRGSFPQPYGLDKWYDDTNGYPFVQVYDVDDNFRLKSETKRRISKEAQDMSVYIEKGSVIITLQGSIGRIAITQYDAYVDRTLLFFESFIVPFDKFFFMLSIFRLFELEKEKAPGGIIKTITKEALSSFKISYPKIEEQAEIATILFDMEAEIKALEAKLEKYRNVKLGMMQNLLTGKIRLV